MMRSLVFLLLLVTAQTSSAQSYQKIHKKARLIDTHNDILSISTEKGFVFDTDLTGKTHSDLERWKQGGLDAQIFSVFCDGDMKEPYKYANRELDTLDAVVMRNPGRIVKVATSRQMIRTIRKKKIAAMAGVEGGHMIEDDINKIDSLFNRGVRYMTLTWNNSTSWATSAFDETFKKDLTYKGLNDFGRKVVQRMNQLGMIVDISHVGEESFRDVIKTTNKPIIASHSSVYALCPGQRNLKDEQIKAIAKNGGVIQINFFSGFLDSNFSKNTAAFLARHKAEWDSLRLTLATDRLVDDVIIARYPEEANNLRADFELVIAHIDYIVKLVGPEYVGIGSDYDGISFPPKKLGDVTTYPEITRALLAKGYSKRNVRKILGGNFLRVLKANEVRSR